MSVTVLSMKVMKLVLAMMNDFVFCFLFWLCGLLMLFGILFMTLFM